MATDQSRDCWGRPDRAGPPARVRGAARSWLRRLSDHGDLLARPGAAHALRHRWQAGWRHGRAASMSADPLFAPPIAVSDFQDDVEVRVFTDVREMLDAGVVDAVDITTEVALHHTQALACLEAGVHAVVAEAAGDHRAGRAARWSTPPVSAASRWPSARTPASTDGIRIAKWLVDRGDLGTPQMASVTALGTAMWSPDHFVGNSAWRHQKLIGAGGASLDIGPHIFHRLRMLCGEVESVAAFARVFEPTRYLRDADGEVHGHRRVRRRRRVHGAGQLRVRGHRAALVLVRRARRAAAAVWTGPVRHAGLHQGRRCSYWTARRRPP